MKIEIQQTQDGWPTLYLPDLDEHYHSINGAYKESEWIYIDRGFIYAWSAIGGGSISYSRPLRVLEMGFGTGLNAILTYIAHYKRQMPLPVLYTAIEAFPLSEELIEQLNYASLLSCKKEIDVYKEIHSLPWEKENSTSPTWHLMEPYFKIRKIQGLIQNIEFQFSGYDIIYYDAFAPKVQPEVWDIEIFKKLYQALAPRGAIITYCAQGAFKKNLEAAGFIVESLEGPSGKREITRATKNLNL